MKAKHLHNSKQPEGQSALHCWYCVISSFRMPKRLSLDRITKVKPYWTYFSSPYQPGCKNEKESRSFPFLDKTLNDEGNTFLKCVDPKGLGEQGLNWRGGSRGVEWWCQLNPGLGNEKWHHLRISDTHTATQGWEIQQIQTWWSEKVKSRFKGTALSNELF